jgi:RNA polymerase primary sigma factor
MVELLIKWRRATAKLQEELGRSPTPEEVGQALDLSKKKLSIIKKAIRINNFVPQTADADAGASLEEMATDSHTRTPDMAMEQSDDLHQVLARLEQMDPREAAVLRMRFGLDDEEPMTLKKIGERLGLTRERVRQIESEALAKMREGLEAA